MSRYVVGIDLGTTNCALAYADTREATDETPAPIRAFAIPQVVGVNDVGERPVLPSFLYLPAAKEFPAGGHRSPLERAGGTARRPVRPRARCQGPGPARELGQKLALASRRGSPQPDPAAERDRRGRTRLPVEASTAYLAHLRDAWNQRIAGKTAADRLEHQDVFLTVPASFDAVARELTVEAARAAGFEQVTLIEEPQAAFYAWLSAQGDTWRKWSRSATSSWSVTSGAERPTSP